VGPRERGSAHKQYRARDIQDLQYWQDKADEAVMILQANFDVLASLRRFYAVLNDRTDFPENVKLQCQDDISRFLSQLDSIMYDFKMQVSRAELLAGIIHNRKGLVSHNCQSLTKELTYLADITTSAGTSC
jgi:hypothetical protein